MQIHTFLGQEQIKRNQVESITVTYTNKVPSNAINSWDVSSAKDESVMAWYIDKDNNNLYELYIGGEGGVKANPTSSFLFQYFNNTTIIDVKYLDTSEVINMKGLFYQCCLLTSLDLSNFKTDNVKYMSMLFASCKNLVELDLNSFNTSQVIDMGGMFSKCKNLVLLDVSSFNTSNVTKMGHMFNECSSLKTLNLSNFNTNQVTRTDNMFYSCSSLTNIDIRKAIFTNVTNYYYMFGGNTNLTTITVIDADVQIFIKARLSERYVTVVTVTIAA